MIVPKSEYQELLRDGNVCVIEQFIKVFVGTHVNTKGNCSIAATNNLNNGQSLKKYKYETSSIKIGLKLQPIF